MAACRRGVPYLFATSGIVVGAVALLAGVSSGAAKTAENPPEAVKAAEVKPPPIETNSLRLEKTA